MRRLTDGERELVRELERDAGGETDCPIEAAYIRYARSCNTQAAHAIRTNLWADYVSVRDAGGHECDRCRDDH